ncbi:hypothetical protein [Phnomibacter sp. MR]|uniref:hypothetical protein n=1 Tax=Phnomibacter sp. MR TaxID=3042318 RepID=UPI003A810D2E
MKSFLLFAGLLFSSVNGFSQTGSMIAEFWIESFSYGTDTVKLKQSISITVKGNSCSQIQSLGKAGNTEIGMQVEVLHSNLGNVSHYVVAKAYFIRKLGKWQKLVEDEHEDITENIASARKARGLDEIGDSVFYADDPDFSVEFKERYTIK